MNENVLRRFIVYTFAATLIMFTAWYFYQAVIDRPPGDYEAEKGDMHLSDRNYTGALRWFDQALQKDPRHLGARMGRAVAFIQLTRYEDARQALTDVIADLSSRLQASPDDRFIRQALAVAYANRGNVHDREGRYRQALDDYIQSLRTDEEAVDGPRLVDKIVHDPRPSTVRKRARYLHEQLQLPEEERVFRVPELDAEQRMYKP